MPTRDAAFAGSIPEIYDRCLGPLLFEPYAADLARRAAELRSARVLETAAGTGILTAALVRALPDADIVAADLNQAMLDVAAERVSSGREQFQAADAQALPFADRAFDLVACQYGVMFFPDKMGAYREARRVLGAGGHFLFNAWCGLDANPVPRIVEQALATLFPADPPGFLGRTPYGYHDPARIRENVTAAGFGDVEVESLLLPSRAASARQAATGFVHGSPLRLEIEGRDPAMLERAADVTTRALEVELGSGSLDAPMTANVVLARET